MSAVVAFAVSGSRRTSGHGSFLPSEGSAPSTVLASAPPCSLGPPRLSEPGEGVVCTAATSSSLPRAWPTEAPWPARKQMPGRGATRTPSRRQRRSSAWGGWRTKEVWTTTTCPARACCTPSRLRTSTGMNRTIKTSTAPLEGSCGQSTQGSAFRSEGGSARRARSRGRATRPIAQGCRRRRGAGEESRSARGGRYGFPFPRSGSLDTAAGGAPGRRRRGRPRFADGRPPPSTT